MVDNCRSTDGEVEGLTEEYTELEILSMVNVGLTSLSKLPSLPKLQKVSFPPPDPCRHLEARVSSNRCVYLRFSWR